MRQIFATIFVAGLALAFAPKEQRQLEKAVRQNPDSAPAHLALGRYCYQTDQYDCALEHYRAAVQLAPADPASRGEYGNLLYFTCRYSNALIQYRMALAQAPDHPALHLALGNLYGFLGRDAEAEA
jgi:Tfp pilus assembly protein PilF